MINDGPNKKEGFVQFCRQCRHLHYLNYNLMLNVGKCITGTVQAESALWPPGLETEEPL